MAPPRPVHRRPGHHPRPRPRGSRPRTGLAADDGLDRLQRCQLRDGQRPNIDPFILPEPGDSSLGIIGNDLTVGQSGEPAYSGIEAHGAGFLKVWHNRLRGSATAGIRASQTGHCIIARNDLDDFEASGGFDIELDADTSGCLVVLGPSNTVVDNGMDNRVFQLW